MEKTRKIDVESKVFEAIGHYGLILKAMINIKELDRCNEVEGWVINDIQDILSDFMHLNESHPNATNEDHTSKKILESEYSCVKKALDGNFHDIIKAMKGYKFFLNLISVNNSFDGRVIEEMILEKTRDEPNNDEEFMKITDEINGVMDYLHIDDEEKLDNHFSIVCDRREDGVGRWCRRDKKRRHETKLEEWIGYKFSKLRRKNG